MALVPESTAIVALALLGALASGAITLRTYQPPDPDEEGKEAPAPVLEAVLFSVLLGAIYAGIGFALRFLAGVAPPVGRLVVTVVGAVGVYAVYATLTGRIATSDTATVRNIGIVSGTMLVALSAAVLVL